MWEFVLRFRLPEGGEDPSAWLDALFEAGCDDATIGVGRHGSIALDVSRDGASAEEAVRSAVESVRKAIPGAVLTEVGPDLALLCHIRTLAPKKSMTYAIRP